ncbi:MAG: glycosyltransferase family 4 protein [Anaerolineae bacterium]|nr:glycosyltransferase family 4 protein [Anaerolineae bacterium]
MRKILVLSPSDIFPPVDGNSENIYHIVKYLAPQHVLGVLLSRVFSQGGPADISHPNLTVRYCPASAFDRLQYKSFLVNPYYYRAAETLMRDVDADIIQCQVLFTILAGYFLKKRYRKPLVLVQENAEYVKQVKFEAPWYATYVLKLLEGLACRVSDRIVAVSEVDKQHMVDLYDVPQDKIHVISHCADHEVFKFDRDGAAMVRKGRGIGPDDVVMTYVGKMDAPHNTVATQYIAERIYPVVTAHYPHSWFMIVGQNYEHLLEYERERLFFTGFISSRKDASPNLTDYLSASDIIIVPMDRGSGTRLKILEAAACSRPIVSTEIGAEGLEFVHGEEILLTKEVDDEFIELLLGLIKDEAWRQRLGTQARKKVVARYSWEREVARFEEVYQGLDSQATV